MTETPCSAGGNSRRFVAGSFAFLISLLLVALLVVVGLPFGTTQASATNAQTPWTVAVTPTTDLSDGARVRITLHTDNAHLISSAKAQVCRTGVNYGTSTFFVPNEDFAIGGANCPSIPISTSADLSVTDGNTYSNAVRPSGESFTILVGVGTVGWNDTGGTARTLTCDAQNPCDLVVQVRGVDSDGVVRWVPFVQHLTYRIDDPIAGCGGPTPGIVSSSSSDRMSRLWVDLTLAQCHSPGAQAGAISSSSFAGEGSAMDMFSRKDVDLAYSAVGYDATIGLGRGNQSEPLTPRPAVNIPIAMNATVLAVGNGHPDSNGDKVPYTNVKLTLDEVTALITGGPDQIGSLLPAIYARNPDLQATGMFSPSSSIRVGAVPDAESTTWFMTGILDTLRSAGWKVPNNNSFGPDAGRDRGTYTSFALADPSFQGVLNLYTGTSILDKTIKLQSTTDYGGIWTVTDLATARFLGLTVVQIQNASGAFVEPTQASMLAAVSSMTSTSDGRLLPNYNAAAANGGVEPYPLTFVEYAVAPLQPLVDSRCNPRPTSQTNLTNWLTYLIHGGQQVLPDGLEPLTPAMASAGEAAITQLGSTANTCTPVPVDPNAGGASAGAVDPLVLPPTAIVSRSAVSAVAKVVPAGSTVAVDAQLASVQAEMPEFVRRSASGNALALLGIVALLGLLTLSAMATSGRLPLDRFRRGGRSS